MAGVIGAGPVGAAAPTGRLTLVAPVRLVDTRSGRGPAAGSSTVLPAGLLTVTVVTHGAAGSADVVACGNGADGEPTFHWSASDVTLVRTVNAVDAGPGWCLVTATAIDLIVDRVAQVDAAPIDGGLQYRPLAEPDLTFLDWVSSVTGWTTTVARPASVPNGDAGATLLVEAVGSGAGSVQVFGCTHTPTTSELGFAEGYSSNVVNVALASSESLCVRVYGSAIVSLSVLGTLTASGPDPTRLPPTVTSRMQTTPPPGFLPVAPLRVLDTRASSKLVPGDRLVLDMARFIDVGTTAVTMNVTVTATEDAGFLTVWPCDQDRPDASNLNFVARQDVPNLVNVPLAYDGTVCFASSASTHVIADLAGTYAMDEGRPPRR